jgi:hypothetical protein
LRARKSSGTRILGFLSESGPERERGGLAGEDELLQALERLFTREHVESCGCCEMKKFEQVDK